MVALDMLGRRGALRVLWELRGDPLTFRALQDACDTNPGSLNTRLRELRDLGIVDHDAGGYRLTEHGRVADDRAGTAAGLGRRMGRYNRLIVAWSSRDRMRRNTLLTVGIGCSSQPSWVMTPAVTNAATRTANQMPTMVSTLLPITQGGIGCFPRKGVLFLEKGQAISINN